MPEVSDMDLMRQYADGDSESAFAELVRRHVNLVYSVALRCVGNSQDAQDVTQAVFIIFAQKAASLRQRTTLTGWLYETTRFSAVRLLRTKARQQAREQEAYMQSTLDNSDTDMVWRQLAPLLEEAMTRLNEKERTLLALRFFENKSGPETAALLGINEWTAHKRASRALEKLRRFLLKRGIHSTTAIIAGAISANSVQAAPAVLAKSVTAAALAKGAAASTATLTLAKATLITMKTKTIVTTIAAAVIILATGSYVTYHAIGGRGASSSKEVIPIKFTNDTFTADTSDVYSRKRDSRFLIGVDPDVRRTTNSAPAGHIKSLVAPTAPGSADYISSTHTSNLLIASSHIRHRLPRNSSLLGKRIRVRGWLKAGDVRNWAGATLYVGNKDGQCFAYDDMSSRPIHGTADWQQIEFVTDIPKEPCGIYFAPTLYGTGEIWSDDVQIDIVPSDTPITDDRIWRVLSTNPIDYSETTDDTNTHDGHPTFCIAYIPPGKARVGSWMAWGHCLRSPESDKYRGRTVRMTAWTKSEGISGNAELVVHPRAANAKFLAKGKKSDNPSIRGATDWTQRIFTCDIPKETQSIYIGFNFYREGKLWIDIIGVKL